MPGCSSSPMGVYGKTWWTACDPTKPVNWNRRTSTEDGKIIHSFVHSFIHSFLEKWLLYGDEKHMERNMKNGKKNREKNQNFEEQFVNHSDLEWGQFFDRRWTYHNQIPHFGRLGDGSRDGRAARPKEHDFLRRIVQQIVQDSDAFARFTLFENEKLEESSSVFSFFSGHFPWVFLYFSLHH